MEQTREQDAWSDDKQLLDWFRLCFHEKEEPESRADVLRRKLSTLFVSSSYKNSNGLPLHYSIELERLHRKYVQCMDNRNGVNNFAGSVQRLVSGQSSESKEWKSELSRDTILGFMHPSGGKHDLDFSTLKLRKEKPAELLGQEPLPVHNPQGANNADKVFSVHQTQKLPSSAESINLCTRSYLPVHSVETGCTRTQRNAFSSTGRTTQGPVHATPHTQPQASGSEDRMGTKHTAQNRHMSAPSGENCGKGRGFQYTNKYSKRKRQRGYGQNNDEDDDNYDVEENHQKKSNQFVTARDQFHINQKKYGGGSGGSVGSGGGQCGESAAYFAGNDPSSVGGYGASKRSLGTRRGPGSKFVPPVRRDQEDDVQEEIRSRVLYGGPSSSSKSLPPELEGDERLRNIDPKMVELITNEIMDHGSPVQWDDIAGLEFAKSTIKEIVVWPMLRPDIFTGLRGPPKGLLLFGPPGTGKTLIGKCVASQVRATFFSISASSLTSKWVGEGEKMVRALFAVARCYQPAVIFIDEIDSLLSQRSDSEHEASRRIKTEFLVQLDGATTSSEDHILVIGATNRPQEIDEAARRRLVKRLYIPLPDMSARKQIITNLLKEQKHSLDTSDLDNLCEKTDGYSGADMANLCRDAAYWPLRSITDIANISADQVRPITFEDFMKSLSTIRPSVSDKDLDIYIEWNKTYGCGK